MDGLAIMLQGQLGARLKSLLLALHLARINNRVLFVFWSEWRIDYVEQTLALSQIWHPLGYILLPWADAADMRQWGRELGNAAIQDSRGILPGDTEMIVLPSYLSGSYLRPEHYPILRDCYEKHFIQWFRRRPLVTRYVADCFLPGHTIAIHLGNNFFGESLEVSADAAKESRSIIDRIIAEDWQWRFFITTGNPALTDALAAHYANGWADLRVRPKPKTTANDVAAEIGILVELCRAASHFIGTEHSDLSAFISFSRGESPETSKRLSGGLTSTLGINLLGKSRCGIYEH